MLAGDAATLTITYESTLVAPTGQSIVNFGTGAAPGSSFSFVFPGLTLTAANQFPLFGNSAPPNVLFVDGVVSGLQFLVLSVPQPFGFAGSTMLTIGSLSPSGSGTFGTEFVFQSFGFPSVPIARGTVDFDAAAVPEPASVALLGTALLLLVSGRRLFGRGAPIRRVAEA